MTPAPLVQAFARAICWSTPNASATLTSSTLRRTTPQVSPFFFFPPLLRVSRAPHCPRTLSPAAATPGAGVKGMILVKKAVKEEDYKLPVPQEVPCLLNDSTLRVSRPAYLPTHLPEYPDPHTFVRTPVRGGRPAQPGLHLADLATILATSCILSFYKNTLHCCVLCSHAHPGGPAQVFEPLEARYTEYRRKKARLNLAAKASMARVAFDLRHGQHHTLKMADHDIASEPGAAHAARPPS